MHIEQGWVEHAILLNTCKGMQVELNFDWKLSSALVESVNSALDNQLFWDDRLHSKTVNDPRYVDHLHKLKKVTLKGKNIPIMAATFPYRSSKISIVFAYIEAD